MPVANVLITGAGGQLGFAVARQLGGRAVVTALSHSDLEITDRTTVRDRVLELRPDWIVNCAAWTNVDGAESDVAGAYRVNSEAVGLLADVALEVGAGVVHFSTDYVFDGAATSPYRESDAARPVNTYGASKLAGEELLLAHPVRSIVLRTSWLYGAHGRNFFRTMVDRAKQHNGAERLRVVEDEVGTPTDVTSLAAQVEVLLESEVDGLVHASCQGEASWLEFAQRIFVLSGYDTAVDAVSASEFPRPARRPAYSVLDNARLRDRGVDRMPPWEEGLRRVVGSLRR